MSGGYLARGVIVQRVYVRGYMSGGYLSGGICPRTLYVYIYIYIYLGGGEVLLIKLMTEKCVQYCELYKILP